MQNSLQEISYFQSNDMHTYIHIVSTKVKSKIEQKTSENGITNLKVEIMNLKMFFLNCRHEKLEKAQPKKII